MSSANSGPDIRVWNPTELGLEGFRLPTPKSTALCIFHQ
jgi:hypothetical protein